jgi:hypothetical protein
MPASERLRQSLIISGQSAEAAEPSETAFDHPSSGQQHETFFGLRMLHHFQLDAVRLGLIRRRFTGVPPGPRRRSPRCRR